MRLFMFPLTMIMFFLAHCTFAADVPEDLVPLVRFYNERVNEHAYASSGEELGAWRVAPKVKEQRVVGMVSAKELPGTVRLWRGVRIKDRKHIYYTQAPNGAAPMNAESKEFQVYVWKKGGDGRIPVYGSTWIDSTDVFFDTNRDNVQKFALDTKKALNVERRSLGDLPVFYVYPAPKLDDPK